MNPREAYKTGILKWTCIGLAVRLLLMPFTMHGQDLLFINYFPMMFVKEGIWDVYGFISRDFPHFLFTYYGPVFFAIMSAVHFIIIKLFHPASLIKMLEISSTMMFQQFTTVDYVQAFAGMDLFRNLFLMKTPYLFFDFFTGFMLLKLAASKESALKSYILWMCNIVVLHSAYMVGQFDLIPAFFIAAALFSAVKKRPYLSVILLALGGAVKLFPYILILPTCLLLGNNWEKRICLALTGGVFALLPYLPFYLSSGSAVLGLNTTQAIQYSGYIKWLLMGIFAASYIFISINAVKDSRGSGAEGKLLFYFLAIGLLTYAVIPIKLQYFIFIMPLLVLIVPGRKRFAVFILYIILILAFLRLHNRYAQWGLFIPLNAEYFVSLPTVQELVGRVINVEIVYKIMARAMVVLFFAAAAWIWRIKLNNETIKCS